MNYLIAAAVPVIGHYAVDKLGGREKMEGPDNFLGMVHSRVPYSGAVAAGIYYVLTEQGFVYDTAQNAFVVGFLIYLPIYMLNKTGDQYK